MITELALTYIRIPHENKTKRNRTEPPCEPSRWRVGYRLDGLGLRLPSTDNTRQRLSGEIRQEALSWGNPAGEVGIVGDIMLSRSFPAITATVDSEREHWFLPGSDQNQQIIEGKKIWETQGMLNTHIITLKKKVKLCIMKSIKQYDKQCNETHTLITRFNNYRLTANLISTLLPSTSVPPKLFSSTAHLSYYFTHKYLSTHLWKMTLWEQHKYIQISRIVLQFFKKKRFVWSPSLLLSLFSMET